ncbi:hypothetical protein [Shewanella frigidimarina]|uniref:hypothetical protein n=1 Tax=Shewanella frigidimarina TaxID=56812 RepID=UPI000F4E020A|nr:hypothetical protein [Shewanella frigidimarina]RPA38320.1 hypothetical protein EGC78_00620 [Shewanella frigidimarina]
MNRAYNKVIDINSFFLFLIHFSLILSCFEFYSLYKIHYISFVIVFIFIVITFSPDVKKESLYLGGCIFVFNLLSQFSSVYNINIFNISWFIQISLLSLFIIFLPTSIQKVNFETHKLFCKYTLFILSFIMLFVSMYTLLLIGVDNIFDQASSYTRLSVITNQFGLFKFIIPLISLTFYLISYEYLTRNAKVFCILSFTIFMLVVLVKTIIISLIVIFIIFLISKIKYRLLKRLTLLVFLLFFSLIFIIYFDVISLLGVINGRYILPIITSLDFLDYPFGFGFGNYSDVMDLMLINLNYSGEYNSDLVRFLGLKHGQAFNTSESDILQFGISFGFIFLIIYFLYIIHLVFRIVDNNMINLPLLACLSILTSGFYQDYSQNIMCWILFSYLLGLSLYNEDSKRE